MSALYHWLHPIGGPLWMLTLQLSLLVGVVLLLRLLFGKILTPRWRSALWAVVLVRLLLPALPDRLWHGGAVDTAMPQRSPRLATVVVRESEPNSPALEPVVSISIATPTNSSPRSLATWAAEMEPLAISSWIAGLLVCLARGLFLQLRLRRLLSTLPPLNDSAALRELNALATQLRIRVPRTIECDPQYSPAVAGFFQPVLILPREVGNRLTPQQLRLVLTHELLHIRRLDVLWRWTAALFVAAQWFNPLIWFARSRFLLDCELATDAAVLRHGGEPVRHAYGEALLTIADWTRNDLPIGTVGMLGRSSVSLRIHRILQPPRSSLLAGIATVLITGCTMLPNRSAEASDRSSALETRSSDVRDLLIPEAADDVRFYTNVAANAASQPASQPTPNHVGFNADLPTGYITARQQLILAVQDGVDRDSWQIRGGRGTVEVRSGQLVVSQTPANLVGVEQVLMKLRSGRGVQIMIETHFLRGPQVAERARALVVQQGNASTNTATINESQAYALLRTVNADVGGTRLTAPRLTTFSGQRAFVAVTSEQPYVSDMTVITSNADAIGFEPVVAQVDTGVVLDCLATASADQKYVALTLHPQQANLLKMTAIKYWQTDAGKRRRAEIKAPIPSSEPFIQMPIIERSSIEATVSLPDRHSFLAVIQPIVSPEDRTPSVSEPVVLLVKPTIADGSASHPFRAATTQLSAEDRSR